MAFYKDRKRRGTRKHRVSKSYVEKIKKGGGNDREGARTICGVSGLSWIQKEE